ncbi:MAG: CRISPR-associated endonuclease Cas3'', partial [Synergistales bacterium]|nr:CRISPR-associated endonuclease Cas3'' [Synergistales bacterium]
MQLHTELFPDYFEAVHGHPPFPWQKRLLDKVMNEGWPRTIALPTASGKTAVMDVAIFALACQSSLPPEKRTAPRRVAMIVDRRIVVDDTYRRACRIREKLENNQGNEVLKAVADALLSLGGEIPLDTALLRGGIY